MTGASAWRLSFEEQLKLAVAPPALYFPYRTARIRRRLPEYRLLPFLIPPGSVALDVGAHKGFWAREMSRFAREVHAFEPNPALARFARWGAAANVTVHQVAISDQSGRAVFRVPQGRRGPSLPGGTLRTTKLNAVAGVLEVDVRTIDSFGFQNVGFAKIDVEGAELKALQGAAQTLRRDRPRLLVELVEIVSDETVPQLVQAVSAFGYDALTVRGGTLAFFDPDASAYPENFVFLPR